MGSRRRLSAFQSGVISWSEQSERTFSWRSNPSPYQVLVAEVLLQRTFAEKVQPVFDEFIGTYPGPGELAKADPDDLEELLEPLGLQRKKAAALVKIGERTEAEGIPRDEESLMELPYVGPYGVNSVMCFGFGERRPIVDANVVRIFNRVFGKSFEGDRDDAAWDFAWNVLPEADVEQYNLGLLDLAAEICTPRSPRCEACP